MNSIAVITLAAAYHASSTASKPPFVSLPNGSVMSKEDIIALLTTGMVGGVEDVPGSDGDLKGLLIISRATAIVSVLSTSIC